MLLDKRYNQQAVAEDFRFYYTDSQVTKVVDLVCDGKYTEPTLKINRILIRSQENRIQIRPSRKFENSYFFSLYLEIKFV